MDFSTWTRAQLEARCAEIANTLDTITDLAQLEELQAVARAIKEEMNKRTAEAARVEIRRLVANGNGSVVESFRGEGEQRSYDYRSPEYRSAWLKNLAVCSDGLGNTVRIFGDLTAEERTAFTHTTQNTGAVVPLEIQNRVISLLENEAPIYADAVKTGFTKGFAIPRHKGIKAGDATSVAEGMGNADDEENDFDQVPFDGVEITKHIILTRKMQFKSIDAFEDYIVEELGKRHDIAKEKVLLARINGTAPAGGSAVPAVAIDSGNVNLSVSADDAGIRGVMALLRGSGVKRFYANNATIWGTIAGIENTNGQKLFTPDTQNDPVTQGRIYGAAVRKDENLADGEFYIIVNGKLLANDFDELTIYSSLEPKTAKTVITGYSLFDGALADPKGAVRGKFVSSP